MSRPRIGLCTALERARWSHWDQQAMLLPRSYMDAVQRAGGVALMVPPDPALVDDPDAVLDVLDGLVMAGGADIDPATYGAPAHPETRGTVPERDVVEVALARRALERDIPFLGICRGMQLLNVVRGGDLVQHLPDESGGSHKQAPGVFARHEVEIAPESRLCDILGGRGTVASHHHQAPQRIGPGLKPVAWSPDGVVEAVEDPDARLALGVLWHPEQGEDRALFRALVECAAEYHEERT